jgi:23S rRNA (guanosine2251-2'-O)-methyltransferase
MKEEDSGRPKESGEEYCWGRNPVISLLENSPSRCLRVLLSRSAHGAAPKKIIELCRALKIPFFTVGPKELDVIAEGESHQGVAASLAAAPLLDMADALEIIPPPPEPVMVVLLDHIQDPRNMGARIRSAEAAGAVLVALPVRRSSLPSGTVAKTSAGASLRMPLVAVGNSANAVKDFKDAGLWVIGLDERAHTKLYDSELPARCALVVGNEGDGISRTAAAACDELLQIPTKAGPGSLNASVALSVAIFEWLRINRMSRQRS